MKTRTKIIVSISAIFLIALILVGLTYAYFLTQITGNSNNKSVSVTTAELRIVYGDGTANVITKENIIPGTVIGEKDFTVTNNGNVESDYSVIIDSVSITDVTTEDPTSFQSNDFVYTLTCVQKNKNTNAVSGTCEGVSSETTLPLVNKSILVSNKIPENMMHVYVLTVTYKETNVNQSNDMNKKLEAKVDIMDIRSPLSNPYSSNTNTLAYNIINNALLGKTGTELRNVPLTMPGNVTSLAGNTSSTTLTDYSNETYFGEYWVAFSQNDYKTAENAIRRYRKYVNPSSEDDAVASDTEINQFLTNDCDSMIGKLVAMVPENYDIPFEFPTYLVTGCENGNPVVTNKESVLSVASDDLGTSYYYRGSVTDNYVNFGGMCWRIVRIQGDGSVKLILEDKDYTCNDASYSGDWNIGSASYGTTHSITNPTYSNEGRNMADFASGMKNVMTTWLGNSSIDQTKLKNESWCIGDRSKMYFEDVNSGYDYGYNYGDLITNHTHSEIYDASISKNLKIMYERLWNLSSDFGIAKANFKCPSQAVRETSYVAAISADELVYAGAKVWKGNDYYLINNYQKTGSDINFWTISLGGFQKNNEKTFYVAPNGKVTTKSVTVSSFALRPTIVLNAGTLLTSGNGTITTPYVIN